jgi:hypothetical protein
MRTTMIIKTMLIVPMQSKSRFNAMANWLLH